MGVWIGGCREIHIITTCSRDVGKQYICFNKDGLTLVGEPDWECDVKSDYVSSRVPLLGRSRDHREVIAEIVLSEDLDLSVRWDDVVSIDPNRVGTGIPSIEVEVRDIHSRVSVVVDFSMVDSIAIIVNDINVDRYVWSIHVLDRNLCKRVYEDDT